LGVFALDAPSRIYAPTAKIKKFDPWDSPGRHAGAGVFAGIRYRMGNCVSENQPMIAEQQVFDGYRDKLRGLPVSHVWRGHGSALFLEFGQLSPGKALAHGKVGNPQGQFGIMIEWSWRIENGSKILCGSWSDDELWEPSFKRLLGEQVVDAGCFGRLPEITVELTSGLHIVSFMTAEGEPEWTIFDRTRSTGKATWIRVKNGSIIEED